METDCHKCGKASEGAYQDVLKEFNSVWGVKGPIMNRSNLVVTWKVRPWMGINLSCPLGFTLVLPRWSYLVIFLQSIFSICAKTNKNMCMFAPTSWIASIEGIVI